MSVRKLTHHIIGGHSVFLPVSGRQAWETDASNSEIVSPIVVPATWAKVFAKGSNPFKEPLSVFMGPKGVGKSTLLHLKRAVVEGWVAGFEAPGNVVCLPAHEQYLSYKSSRGLTISIRADSPEGHLFKDQNAWVALWSLLLGALVLQADYERRHRVSGSFRHSDGQTGRDADEFPQRPSARVLELFDKVNQRIEPQDVVRCIRAAVGKPGLTESLMRDLYEKELLPALRDSIGATRYCMFVDAIDEHIQGDNGQLIDIIRRGWLQPGKGDTSADTQVASSYNVWANAQAGLVLAAENIFEDTFGNVRVFAPIRTEAYHAAAVRVAGAQLVTCAPVQYSRDKLEAIVRLNMAIDLELHSKERFFSDNGSMSTADFNRIEHVFFQGRENYYAYGIFNRRWVEEIVRFSMDRPREVIVIGKSISRAARPDVGTLNSNDLLMALRGSSREVLDEYLNFIVGKPVADEFKSKVFPFIRANVLQQADMVQIQRSAANSGSTIDHPMCKLYALGVIGAVQVPAETMIPIQHFEFRQAGALHGQASSLPSDAICFVVHPLLEHCLPLITQLPNGQAADKVRTNQTCPLGNDLPWVDAPRRRLITLTLKNTPELACVDIDGQVIVGQVAKRAKSKAKREDRVATANSRPNVFLIAWLYTLATRAGSQVVIEDVLGSIDELTAQRVFKPRMSVQRKVVRSKAAAGVTKPTPEAMRLLLDGVSDAHNVPSDLRRYLGEFLDPQHAILRCEQLPDGEVQVVSALITAETVRLVDARRPTHGS